MTKKSEHLVEFEFEKDSGYVGTVKYVSLSYSQRIREASQCGVSIDSELNYSFGDDLMNTIAMMSDLVVKQVREVEVECVASGEKYTELDSLSHSEDAAGFFQAIGLRLIMGSRMGKRLPSK